MSTASHTFSVDEINEMTGKISSAIAILDLIFIVGRDLDSLCDNTLNTAIGDAMGMIVDVRNRLNDIPTDTGGAA
ncbi:hypothetical protein [Thauera sp. SDU_THAU2]|uniref:hypothetical protein n=1 Tax=Thauera sp. SDU_THAU2 TaxID=3136633 RepID=UPI00311DFC73